MVLPAMQMVSCKIAMPPWFLLGSGLVVSMVLAMSVSRHPEWGLADFMLENGVPLPVISGTLGHSDPHSTETYLRLDLSQLRKCALEVDA